MGRDGLILRIHSADNVAVALADIRAGVDVGLAGGRLRAVQRIPRGHKIALCRIGKGAVIRKYGFPIGQATAVIPAGAHVHVHNMTTGLKKRAGYSYTQTIPRGAATGTETGRRDACGTTPATFDGFVRADGSVGVRNEIWIVNTVGCVNGLSRALAQAARAQFSGPGLDGIYSFEHPFGCSQLGPDHALTQKLLAGLVRHPNAAGVLVLGLGCENNNITAFRKVLGKVNPRRVKFLNAQDAADEMRAGLRLIGELADYAAAFKRQSVPLSKLVVGLKCGGSDGLSGITANPLAGAFADALVARGGTAILTEVPEMFGGEAPLLARCVNRQVFAKARRMIEDFKDYYSRQGQVLYENPSPGNKAGGISTLEEKSLGCIQKGGHSPVADVRACGAQVIRPGLNLVSGPGNDLVASTVLTAAGAHLILFTTGRGTPLGAPVPTIKISTNSALAHLKPHWIDFDAGVLLAQADFEPLAAKLFDYVIAVAGGRKRTCNEQSGYREIALFKNGVTL